jgi:hypothetical protein
MKKFRLAVWYSLYLGTYWIYLHTLDVYYWLYFRRVGFIGRPFFVIAHALHSWTDRHFDVAYHSYAASLKKED